LGPLASGVRTFLLFVFSPFLLFSLSLPLVPSVQAKPPNVLFLLADDQRPDTIAALGNKIIDTPYLDSLVKEGTTFTRATCANPLCVPSRVEILTGTSGFRNGVLPGVSNTLKPGLAWWPEVLSKGGYHTWYVGKWHTAGRPSTRGYEESLGLFGSGAGAKAPPQVDFKGRPVTGYRGWVFQTDDRKLFLDRGIGLTPDISNRFADAAITFLKRKPQRPFFLHVNFTAPHDPLLWPPGFEKKYDPKKMPLPVNYLPRHPFDHGNIRGRDEVLLPFPRTKRDIREELAAYYAVISHLDQAIGRILNTLKETGQADNTIVIFSSDHGLAIGSHGLRGKQNMYEHTIGVPLILRGPGIPRNARRDAQVYLRDLFPTVCELAHLEIPSSVQGKSLAGVIAGKEKQVYPHIFGYFKDVQRMIRTERWKLIYYPKINRYQLFDLSNDPHELKDLAQEAKYARVRAELKEKLEAWQREVGEGKQ
jgi:arylsulfatase A-like enzyme